MERGSKLAGARLLAVLQLQRRQPQLRQQEPQRERELLGRGRPLREVPKILNKEAPVLPELLYL